jgi:hypothetical protein
MINSFLKDLKDDINNLIKSSLKIKIKSKTPKELETSDSLLYPIFYEKQLFPYCRNNFLDNEYFDIFYNIDTVKHTNGLLFEIIRQIDGIKMESINFCIFTLINLNPNVNNTPNPPYINLGKFINHDLIVNREVGKLYIDLIKPEADPVAAAAAPVAITKATISTKELDTIKTIIKELAEILNFYKFYKTSKLLIEINKFILNDFKIAGNAMAYAIIRTNLINLIQEVTNNNLLTLIGSLETTEHYQNIAYINNTCSFNKEIDEMHNGFRLRNNDEKSLESFKEMLR